MVRALGAEQNVLQHVSLSLLNQLLQGGLVVSVNALGDQLGQILLHQRQEEAIDDAHGGIPRIQVNGGQERLEGVGQDVLLVVAPRQGLALTEKQTVADADGAGVAGQSLGTDHVLAHVGQRSLSLLGIGGVEVAADGDG